MAVTDTRRASEAVEEVTARVIEAVSENAEQVQQKAAQLAELAKEVSKSTAESGRSAVQKVGKGAGRGSAPYIAGGLLALVLVWVLVKRRRGDKTD
jgi:hypothetical protein